MEGAALLGADDLHVDLLGFHEVTVEDVEVGGVGGALADEAGFEVVEEAQLYLQSRQLRRCYTHINL